MQEERNAFKGHPLEDNDPDATQVYSLTLGTVNTQKEVHQLEEENVYLRIRLTNLNLKEKNEYHAKKIEEKLGRQDTLIKRKTLVIKGLPENKEGENGDGLQHSIHARPDGDQKRTGI